MNMQMLVRIGLLCMEKIMKLFTLIVLVLHTLLKKLKSLLDIKIEKQRYLECKQTIQ